jgi:cobalt-zinc-cadmium efflux system membrane fusion protein
MNGVHPVKKMVVHGFLMVMACTQCGCGETGGSAASHSHATTTTASASAAAPVQPLVQAPKAADWCKEHGVPESVCTKCNTALVADFQKKGDWCKSHGLPESQCIQCNPALEAKFKAMGPK